MTPEATLSLDKWRDEARRRFTLWLRQMIANTVPRAIYDAEFWRNVDASVKFDAPYQIKFDWGHVRTDGRRVPVIVAIAPHGKWALSSDGVATPLDEVPPKLN